MKDIFNVLCETPLIVRFSIKDSEKTYIWKLPRSKLRGSFQIFDSMAFKSFCVILKHRVAG